MPANCTGAEPASITVEVAYALPGCQYLRRLSVPQGCSALEAVWRSGLVEEAGLDPASLRLGVFGRLLDAPQDCVLDEGDRVEIHRPLAVDPMQARRARAARRSR